MNDFWLLCGWSFLLVFGSLVLCVVIASAHVASEEAEREREREWMEFMQRAQESSETDCAIWGHDWISEPLLNVDNICRRCGADMERERER